MYYFFYVLEKMKNLLKYFMISYIRPIDPAVNPTTKKNANSVRSLGIEFTKRLI